MIPTIKKYDIALFLLRLVFGVRLIYGSIDNIVSWERMLEFRNFLESFHFPFPLVAAIVSVYLQFVAGVSWVLGYQTKVFSALMVFNFIVAITFVHIASGDTYLGTAPAIHLLVFSLFLFVAGPGEIAFGGKGGNKK